MKIKGFTLAELLIVIGVVGIIAESTIPVIINNFNTKVTVVALKKTYSMLSSAYTLAVQENGTPENWSLSLDSTGAINAANKLIPYLNILKNCQTASGCFPSVQYKQLNGVSSSSTKYDTLTSYAKIQLQDGTSILFSNLSSDCTATKGSTLALQNVCTVIYVDINGFKPPNQYGVDFFNFRITKYGIDAPGSQFETGTSTFASSCKDKTTAVGNGCTAWVLENENLDYFNCSDLAWDVKLKCN